MNNTEVENKWIDEKFFHGLCTRWKMVPSHQTLGLNLTYLGPGSMGLKKSVGREYTTVQDRLHGGIIATLADTAMGWAILTMGRTCVTIDMYLNYLAPVFHGSELIAEGFIVYSGKSTAVAEANLFNDKGEIMAKSRGTFSLKQKINFDGTTPL